MSSPDNPVSDENQIPAGQNAHHKSVGRNPLKVLSGQHLAVLDPNILVKERPSLSRTSSHSALVSKEPTTVHVGTPVSVWIEPCHIEGLPKSSETESSTSKKLPYCFFLEAEVLEGDSPALLSHPKNCDQSSQTSYVAIQSQPEVSSDPQTANSGYEDNRRLSVNDNLKFDKPIDLSSTITTNELPELQRSPVLEDHTYQKVMLMLDESESHDDDAYSVLIPGGLLKHEKEPHKIPLENLDSKDEDNIAANDLNLDALRLSKPDIFFGSIRNDSQLEELPFAREELDGVEEPNVVMSANITYEIDPRLNATSEQSAGAAIDLLSEVTDFIGNWHLSIKGHDDYSQNEEADDGGNAEGRSQAKKLSSSLPGTLMNDLKETKTPSALPETLYPEPFPAEDCLTGGFFHDSEISLLCNSLLYMTSEDECYTPVDGVTTDHILTEGDSTPLTHAQWFPPISDMDQVSAPKPSPDQGHVVENDPFAEGSPTPIMPSSSKVHKIPLLKAMCKNITPRMFASPHEAGTSMTPVSIADGVTWTTPIMLLNKSMNTSCNFITKGEKCAKDNASETDSVLWNFSREALGNASREELMDRLEGTLIVVEVLSRQLQGWQQNDVSSKPSEQRECATQTHVTYTSAEEQYYHNLYSDTLNKLRSVQRSREQEETLQKHLQVATEALGSFKKEVSSMIEFAKSLYETAQKDRADLQQKMSYTRKLLAAHMNILEKMSKKSKDFLHQRNEMRTDTEKAMQAKNAADLCLQELEIHSSSVIAQLRRDLESEKQLCQSVKEAYKQQHSCNEDLAKFVHRAQNVVSEVKEDRTLLQTQCSQAKELMSRHRHLFEVMKEKTQSALEEYEGLKMQKDMAVLENEKLYSQFESMQTQSKQMKLENSRLGSELELLMGRLCTLESKMEQLKEENAEFEELLSAKDSSMKLLGKELNEATARGQEYQDRIKHLTGQIVPSLEMDLSKALKQKQALQKQLEMLAKEHASQITYYTETLEFLEQENSVCREQVTETESQLRTHHLTVLERNFQCEDLKDTVTELQNKVGDLQEKLSHSQEEARSKIMKLSREISDSSMEIYKIKSHMLELIENLSEDTKAEAMESLPGSQTPGRSLVLSKDEDRATTNISTADLEGQREGIWSKTSAFTAVLPVTSPSSDTAQEHLPVVVRELSSIVAEVVTTSSSALEKKQRTIQDFKMEISSLKEAIQSVRFQHTSDVRVLQEELGSLKRRNCVLDQKVNGKEKCISELQEVVNRQEQKLLQQFSKSKESEVLIQENAELQLTLKVCEKQVEVLKHELAQSSPEAARNWIQEKLLLHKDLTTLRLKLIDTEYSKSEAVQRLLRHRDIMKGNLDRSDAEVQKLDNVIERVRQDLLSIPEVVTGCDKLRQLKDFLD